MNLAGYSPWGRKELDTTERPSTQKAMRRWAKHTVIINVQQWLQSALSTHTLGEASTATMSLAYRTWKMRPNKQVPAMWDYGCCSVRKPRLASVLDESPRQQRSNGSSCSQSPGDLPAENHQATVGNNRALGHQVVGVFIRQQKRCSMEKVKSVLS